MLACTELLSQLASIWAVPTQKEVQYVVVESPLNIVPQEDTVNMYDRQSQAHSTHWTSFNEQLKKVLRLNRDQWLQYLPRKDGVPRAYRQINSVTRAKSPSRHGNNSPSIPSRCASTCSCDPRETATQEEQSPYLDPQPVSSTTSRLVKSHERGEES